MAAEKITAYLVPFPAEELLKPAIEATDALANIDVLLDAITEIADAAEDANDRGDFFPERMKQRLGVIKGLAFLASEQRARCYSNVEDGYMTVNRHTERRAA
jgi:hypothetical protein